MGWSAHLPGKKGKKKKKKKWEDGTTTTRKGKRRKTTKTMRTDGRTGEVLSARDGLAKIKRGEKKERKCRTK